MATSNKLKSYARLDGQNKTVAGSLIKRKSAPKVGNWLEVKSSVCCNAILPFTYTVPSATMTNATFRIFSSGTQVAALQTHVNSTSEAGLLSVLNQSFGDFALFTNVGLVFTMSMTEDFKKAFVGENTLTFTILAA